MDENIAKLDRRLSRIEGQVRGLRRMLAEGAYCTDIISQLNAARSALDQVGAQLVVRHVRGCILGHDDGTAHPKAATMSSDDLIEELEESISRLMRS